MSISARHKADGKHRYRAKVGSAWIYTDARGLDTLGFVALIATVFGLVGGILSLNYLQTGDAFIAFVIGYGFMGFVGFLVGTVWMFVRSQNRSNEKIK